MGWRGERVVLVQNIQKMSIRGEGWYPGGLSSRAVPHQPFLVVEEMPSPTWLLLGPVLGDRSSLSHGVVVGEDTWLPPALSKQLCPCLLEGPGPGV